MASENKKRKLKNSHLWKGGLKMKTKLRRVGFYNSAVRQELKRTADNAMNGDQTQEAALRMYRIRGAEHRND